MVKIDQTRSHAAIRRSSDILAAVMSCRAIGRLRRGVFYLRPCCDLAVQRGLSVRWLAGRETLRLSDWRPSLGNVMVQTPEIRIKKRLINPNEKRCPACDGSDHSTRAARAARAARSQNLSATVRGMRWQGTDTEGRQVRIIMVRSFIVGSMMATFAANCATVFAASNTSQCRVMDPTGTPLNVRTSPDGRIVGNLPNDMLVTVIDHANRPDRQVVALYYISKFSDGKPVGWVFRDFVSCN
jgi:hypothetical protein